MSRSGGIQLFVTVSQSRVLSVAPVVVRSTLVSAHSFLPLEGECAHTVSESLMRIDDMHFARTADFALGLQWSREWRGVRAECCVLFADLALSRLSSAGRGELVEVAEHAEEGESDGKMPSRFWRERKHE